ncbi:MAG: ribonuclease HII [Patescibacteria group bacterium]
MNYKYIIGIDEAGRGPLAGSVSVGAVLFSKEEYKKFKKESEKTLTGRDSKKLSEKKREEWFKIIEVKKKAGVLNFSIGFSSAKVIDIYGIVYAINKAIEKIFSEFKMKSDECVVLLDGNLKAPKKFKNQKTIIKGDEKELIISLASIIAKVSRDRYIVNLSKKYPEYGFEKHKGYGTKVHYEMIEKHGICAIHRRTFLKNSPIK